MDTWEIEAFVDYLKFTLIPDLQEAGSECTADDFQTAVDIIEQLQEARDE